MQDWGERSDRWSGIRTEWLDVQGTAVRTLRADAAPGAEDGTPIVLVHGLGGSATNWLEVMNGLAQRGPVLAMDLPGFGETEPPRTTASRVTANARFLPALCRALGWERVVLMGNSMGGMISTLVAGRHPDLVESLVLVNPGLPAPVSAAHKAPKMALLTFAPFLIPKLGEKAMRARYKRYSVEELAEQTRRLVFGDPERSSEAMRQVGIDHMTRARDLRWRLPAFVAAAESLMGLLVGTGRGRVHEAIANIEAPTLLVWGDDDQLVGEAVIQGLMQRRTDWEQHTFETVGHVPMMEVPDEFLTVVEDFLDRSEAPAALAS